MNINYKQPQFELFPANSALLEDVNKPRFLLANLTLSIENLVILGILAIMLGLFSFSLGVERGKQVAARALDERVSAAWNVGAHKPVAKPVSAVVTAAAVQKPVAVAPAANRPAGVQKSKAGNGGFIAVQPQPKPAAVARRFTVQAATYKSEQYAKQEALVLKAKGLPSFLIKKGDFWLVCAGQFSSSQSAEAALKKTPAKIPRNSEEILNVVTFIVKDR